MQTDLRLLLLIMGFVYISYVIYKIFRKKRPFIAPELIAPVPLQETALCEAIVTQDTHKIVIECNDLQVIDVSAIQPPKPFWTSPLKTPVAMQEKTTTPEFILLNIVPKGAFQFSGKKLLETLKKCHFHFGKKQIFYKHHHDDINQPMLYSVLSMVEPGSFVLYNMEHQSFPGIILLMVTPSDIHVFEKMLASAKQLSEILVGELLDAKRQPVTQEMVEQYRGYFKE